MKCARPLAAWRAKHRSPGGKWPVVFHFTDGLKDKPVDLPCGSCMPCRVNKAETWANRLEHESSMHRESQFLTLTYAELPPNGSLQPQDMQLFLKRLREHLQRIHGKTIRYFQVGEYGDSLGRPHHHMLLFGHRFTDCQPLRTGQRPLYTSPTLETLWTHGFVTLGNVTPQSIRYCASYITKRITGPLADAHYGDRVPEYATMSRRPGIGTSWASKWAHDLFPAGHLTLRNGAKLPLPRLYLDHHEKRDAQAARDLKLTRRLAAVHDKTTYRQRRAKHQILTSQRNTMRKGTL